VYVLVVGTALVFIVKKVNFAMDGLAPKISQLLKFSTVERSALRQGMLYMNEDNGMLIGGFRFGNGWHQVRCHF
jgi:hypothetical protein